MRDPFIIITTIIFGLGTWLKWTIKEREYPVWLHFSLDSLLLCALLRSVFFVC